MDTATSQIGPRDDVKVTLYSGSFDNIGRSINLADARRIVQVGDHEIYSKIHGCRVRVDFYTPYIRLLWRQWAKEGYAEKQIKEQFDKLKGALPAVTWSGAFTMARRADLITKHSGMIVADVDKMTPAQIQARRGALAADPHVWLLFMSPSETGMKIVFPLAGLEDEWPVRQGMAQPEYAAVANQFQHAAYFAIRKHMLEKHELRIDGACKDSSRLCYLPCDPDVYSNSQAEPLMVSWSKDIEEQIGEERAREREEAAQKRDQAKAETAGPSSKSRPAQGNASTGKPGSSQANGKAENKGMFYELSDPGQENLVDACLAVLNPDIVPDGFGATENPGDRHRWDVAVGMAIHSWDAGDRGLQKYLAWGEKSAHKSENERAGYWTKFSDNGKTTIGTLLKFGGGAGVRMPWAGQNRDAGRQEKMVTVNELLANHDLIDASKTDKLAVRGLMEFAELPSDPEAVLLGDRWLLRQSAALVFAPSGVGKSTFVAQAVTLWSLGLPAFGIKPSKPLRVLCFQAEDDDLDIREIVAGVKMLFKLSHEQCQQVNQRVKVVRSRRSGVQFFEDIMLPSVVAFRPDLIIINPVMAYIDCDMAKQDQAAGFFRRMIGEILESFNIGAILVHHTPKPGNTDVTKLNPYQEQYLAFGSSDLINWVRATLMIWPTAAHGIFEFRASKRREKIGWNSENPIQGGDAPPIGAVFTRLYKHWQGRTRIGDEDVDITAWVEPTSADQLAAAQARKQFSRRGGRGRSLGPHDLVAYMPASEPMTLKQIGEQVRRGWRERGTRPPSQRTIQRALRQATGEVEVDGQRLSLVRHQDQQYTRIGQAET